MILQTAYEDKKKPHVHHILFVGKQLSNARIILFNELYQIHDLGIINSHISLWGNGKVDYKTNVRMFTAVQKYNQFLGIYMTIILCFHIFPLTFLVLWIYLFQIYDNCKLFVLEWESRKKSERVFKPMHWIHHEYNTCIIYVQNIEYFMMWQSLRFISPSRVHRY